MDAGSGPPCSKSVTTKFLNQKGLPAGQPDWPGALRLRACPAAALARVLPTTGQQQDTERGRGMASDETLHEDAKVLHSMGYAQELSRRMSGFSNFAISFSIICILSGGINSFAQATSSIGGAG